MPKILVQSAKAPVTGFTDSSTPSPLAQAIRAGDFLYVSGQGPLDPGKFRDRPRFSAEWNNVVCPYLTI